MDKHRYHYIPLAAKLNHQHSRTTRLPLPTCRWLGLFEDHHVVRRRQIHLERHGRRIAARLVRHSRCAVGQSTGCYPHWDNLSWKHTGFNQQLKGFLVDFSKKNTFLGYLQSLVKDTTKCCFFLWLFMVDYFAGTHNHRCYGESQVKFVMLTMVGTLVC